MKIPFLHRLPILSIAKSSSAQRNEAAAVVAQLLEHLPDLLAAAVIDIETGQALASHAAEKQLDPAKVAGYNAEVVKQKQRALAALGLMEEKIEDILVEYREQTHLLHLMPDGKRLLFLAVSVHDTSLALARQVLRDCATS